MILFGRVIIPKISLGLACKTIGLGFGLTTGRPLRAEIWSGTLEVGAIRTMFYFTVGFISRTNYTRKIENLEDVLGVHPPDFRVLDHWSNIRSIPCGVISHGEVPNVLP